MTQETRQCQNCHGSFIIESEDFQFYEKIQVPPPTFCPKCRLQRRLAFFNLTNLYKRKCDLCQQEKISMYPPDSPYTVYCPQCWWSDKWDPTDYGVDYDFSRPFFDQYKELWQKVPSIGLSIDTPSAQTSPHTNHAGHLKNDYLLFHADYAEDSAYGFFHLHTKSVFDSSAVMSSELCYDMMNVFKSNHCIGGRNQVVESLDCAFVRDAQGCQSCFGSANIRNQKYQFFNQQLTKDQYQEKIKEYDLGSYQSYQKVKKDAENHWKKFPPKPSYEEFNVNSTGNYIFQSKNAKECYEVTGAEDSKFLLLVSDPPIKDCYDIFSWGSNLTIAYEGSNVGENASNLKFCNEAGLGQNGAEYCKLSNGGSNHFGCVSFKKGEYIIFNKKYSKEEYFKLRQKIKKHMDEMPYVDKKDNVYKYGEFFPIELSPFAYNETFANNFFPLIKEEIIKNGYAWRDEEKREHTTTIQSKNLPDHIKDVPENILNEIIGCSTCSRGYRITEMELNFLKKMNLPIPRECPFCRIKEKINRWVKNMQSVERLCNKCSTSFKTPFTKEEYPLIYCKNCYLKEYIG
ncbi:MAG: hypothetical protein Q7R86_02760 [bacterium]|nr:hypothetical protein [bacterium]